MNPDLFRGDLVRLTSEEPRAMAEAYSRWNQDSEFWRLMASNPPQLVSVKSAEKWLSEHLEPESVKYFSFGIRTLSDDRLVGDIGLDEPNWTNRYSFVGISIGDRQDWGKGYGTDAMRLLLRYAFTELNLQQVSLTVFEYNPRAIRSYQKVGFKEEGRIRGLLHREGQRWDLLFMGILKSEWENTSKENPDGS